MGRDIYSQYTVDSQLYLSQEDYTNIRQINGLLKDVIAQNNAYLDTNNECLLDKSRIKPDHDVQNLLSSRDINEEMSSNSNSKLSL